MRHLNLRFFVAMAIVTMTAACMATPEEEPTYLPEGTLTSVDEQALAAGDFEPGESPDAATSFADCVYIQWCNEPGPNGTICRLRSGCTYNTTTVNECIADAYAVCGSPVSPWYIY